MIMIKFRIDHVWATLDFKSQVRAPFRSNHQKSWLTWQLRALKVISQNKSIWMISLTLSQWKREGRCPFENMFMHVMLFFIWLE